MNEQQQKKPLQGRKINYKIYILYAQMNSLKAVIKPLLSFSPLNLNLSLKYYELASGDNCTTLWIYENLLNCTL